MFYVFVNNLECYSESAVFKSKLVGDINAEFSKIRNFMPFQGIYFETVLKYISRDNKVTPPIHISGSKYKYISLDKKQSLKFFLVTQTFTQKITLDLEYILFAVCISNIFSYLSFFPFLQSNIILLFSESFEDVLQTKQFLIFYAINNNKKYAWLMQNIRFKKIINI